MSSRRVDPPELARFISEWQTADGMFIVGLDQRIVHWNQSARGLLGYPARGAIGSARYELLSGNDLKGMSVCRRDCPVVQKARRGETAPAHDLHARTSGGSRAWINASTLLAIEPVSETPGVAYVFRDPGPTRSTKSNSDSG